jgi:small neutral amino acid transporter SnatA (MarC family)
MWEERLHEFVTLFLVINPIGAIPIFLVLFGAQDSAAQRNVAFAVSRGRSLRPEICCDHPANVDC